MVFLDCILRLHQCCWKHCKNIYSSFGFLWMMCLEVSVTILEQKKTPKYTSASSLFGLWQVWTKFPWSEPAGFHTKRVSHRLSKLGNNFMEAGNFRPVWLKKSEQLSSWWIYNFIWGIFFCLNKKFLPCCSFD